MQITATLVKELRERTGAGMMDCKKALTEVSGDIGAAADLLRKAGQAKADKKAGRVAAEGLIIHAVNTDASALVEINCETDFVARREDFQQFGESIAELALKTTIDDVNSLADIAIGQDSTNTVDERRRELVAVIGENITVRRAAVVKKVGDHLGVYMHHSNKTAAVVDLKGGNSALARDIAMHVTATRPLALDENSIPQQMVEKEREIVSSQIAESGKPEEIQQKMLVGRMAKFVKEHALLGQTFVKEDITIAKLLAANKAEIISYARLEVGEGIEKSEEA